MKITASIRETGYGTTKNREIMNRIFCGNVSNLPPVKLKFVLDVMRNDNGFMTTIVNLEERGWFGW